MTFGIDVAQMDLNGERVADWMTLAKEGVSFALLRKSQCYRARDGRFVLAIDPTYRDNVGPARAAGIVVGGYCFPDFAKGRPEMSAQVGNYKAAGPARLPGKDLPDYIDIEFPGNGIVDTGRSQTEVAADLLELANQMESQLGRVCGEYTSHVQMHDTNGLGGKGSPLLGRGDLWQKVPYHLAAQKPLDPAAPIQPHIGAAAWDPHDYWRVPTVWEKNPPWIEQTQGDARGITGVFQADVNRWRYLSKANGDDPRIRIVQDRLVALGYMTAAAMTGMWDASMTKTMEQFQRGQGLQDDAVIGPATYVALFP